MSVPAPSSTHAARWMEAFTATLQRHETAGPLKRAALGEKLGEWTGLLTAALVQSAQGLGWCAAAKGFPLALLPQAGQEYLGIDVMAFEGPPPVGERSWRFPLAAFELENSRSDDRVAYSLWKVLCLRCPVRVVFAYRKDWEQARGLIAHLTSGVLDRIPVEQRGELHGQTLVVVGSRGEGEAFPWGYFKFWGLDARLGQFRKV